MTKFLRISFAVLCVTSVFSAYASDRELRKDADGDVTFETIEYARFLIDYVAVTGNVRVIVTLDVEFTNEKKLTEDGRKQQRTRFLKVQNGLVNAIRSSNGTVKIVKGTGKKPEFTADVDAEGLMVFIEAPIVTTIRGKRLKRP